MPPVHPSIFIGSSTLALPVAQHVAQLIADFALPRVWESVFGPTGGTFPDLMKVLPEVDAAVLIFSPDDRLSQFREGEWSAAHSAPRDNIVFELGLLIGALGRERVVFLEPAPSGLVMATDLKGVNSIPYPGQLADEVGWEKARQKLAQWLAGEELRADTRPIIAWPTPHAEAKDLLKSHRGTAQHSLLLLGNTLAQIHAIDEMRLAQWLAADHKRRIGKLFLNPHSPHARGRDRPHLHRGAREAGIKAYRQALEQPLHPRCLPLVYDGPYRYSMRCLDVAPHTRNPATEIHVAHSTHHRGIAGGFSHSLPYHRGVEAFESFATDALELWKSAHANPPGHGLALAVCWEHESAAVEEVLRDALVSAARQLVPSGEFYLNGASQWHYTLASLRRTGPRWGGPLSLSADRYEERLPSAFVEYAVRSCEQLRASFREANLNELVPEITHLKLTPTGHLIACNPEVPGPLAGAMTGFLESRTTELKGLGLEAREGGLFAPKHVQFWPHVSVGMAFQNDAALPEPLTFDGKERVVRLPEPMRWRSPRFHAVHYAYRTFRRLVGALAIPLEGGPIEGLELVRSLGLG